MFVMVIFERSGSIRTARREPRMGFEPTTC
jgi:hypothetical protein